MRRFRLVSSTTAFSLLASAFLVPAIGLPSAQAQTENQGRGIVVTARVRAESVQDIPFSVTAFTTDDIDRGGFQDFEDVAKFSPGVQFNNELGGLRPGRLFTNIRIRGIERSTFAQAQTVSLFVDGVFALQAAQSLALVDLERIEVLKGPQNTLFGRNSFAGAVNYVTSTPSLTEFSGKLNAEAATFGQYEVSGSVDIPVIQDKLSIRVGGRFYNKGEMYTASDGGALGEQQSTSAFGVLYSEPTDWLRIKIRGYYQQDDDGPEAVGFLVGRLSDTCTGTTRPGFATDGTPTTLMPTGFICGTIPAPGEALAPPIDQNTSIRPQILAALGMPTFLQDNHLNFGQIPGAPDLDGLGLRRNISRVSGVGEFDLPWSMTGTITASWNKNVNNNYRDWDQTPVENWYVSNEQTGKDYSIDARIQSSGEQRLRWLGGFNWYKQEYLNNANGGIFVTVCPFVLTCDVAGGGAPSILPVPVDGGDFVNAWAFYGSASFDIFENITVDAEFRYVNDTRKADGTATFEATYKNWMPRFSLSYRPIENVNAYFTASRGILPGLNKVAIINCATNPGGGVTPYIVPFTDPRTLMPSFSSPCQQFVDALGSEATDTTEQLKLNSLEAGLKTDWFDGRLIVNVAGYYMEYKNSPYNTFVTLSLDDDGDLIPNGDINGIIDLDHPTGNPNFQSVPVSGSSKYYGMELEASAELMEGWTANFNWAWNENELTEFFTSLASQSSTLSTDNLMGNRASRFPRWSGSLTSTYTHALYGDWDGYIRGDIIYQGKAPSGTTNLADIDSYFLVNLRLGIQQENMRFEFFVKNLLGEDKWAGGQEFTDFSVRPTFFDFSQLGAILIPQDRRTFGFKASVSF